MSLPSSQPSKNKTAHQDALKKLGLGAVLLLLLVNTVQLARFGGIVERVDGYNKGVVDEIGKVRQDVMMFGNDINEMREFLLLPTKDYSLLGETTTIEPGEVEQKNSMAEAALYQFLAQTTEEETTKKNAVAAEKTYQSLIEEKDELGNLRHDLALKGFSLEAKQQRFDGKGYSIEDQQPTDENFSLLISAPITEEVGAATELPSLLFTILIEKKTNKVFFNSLLGSQEIKATSLSGYSSEILKLAQAQFPKVKALTNKLQNQKIALTSIVQAKPIADILQGKKMVFADTIELQEKFFVYSFLNNTQEKVAAVSLKKMDGSFLFQNKTYATVEELQPALIAFLTRIDVSTSEQKQLRDRKKELETIFKEKAFADLLKTNGLAVTLPPREEYNKVVYDVVKSDKSVAFSFVIEVSSGMYKVLKDGEELDLYSFLDPEGSKKKS